MRNPGHLLRQTPPHVRTLALRTGIGAALCFGTLALAHLMPTDTLDSPVKTIAASEAPSFDFVPAKPGADVAGPNLPADVAKSDVAKSDVAKSDAAKGQTLAAETNAAAPLPPARPQAGRPPVVLASARASDAIVYPAGVERFDQCQARCESRDPAVFGTPQPLAAAAPVPPPPEATPHGPLQSTLNGAMGVIGSGKQMVDGALGNGKRMVDGALNSATATLVGVKEAMLGAITPDH